MSSNCLVFHTSGGISSSPAAFLFLIFLITESSSSRGNGPSLMSNFLLIILMIGSCVTFGGFPRRFSNWSTQFKKKIVLFHAVQLSICTQFRTIWPIDRTLLGSTTSVQKGLGSDDSDGTPHSTKLQHYRNLTIRSFSVISRTLVGMVLPLCRGAVDVFYRASRLGNTQS